MTYRSLAAPSASIDATAAREMVALHQPNNGSRDPALDDRLPSVADAKARDMSQRSDLVAQGELGAHQTGPGAQTPSAVENLWSLPPGADRNWLNN
ncbi:hypothetical protein [Methylocystis sp.]|uniref:hypothetical protein n=1 Tax=Methylocystis sp. TaxID=1911079 RepID=UPI003D13F10E